MKDLESSRHQFYAGSAQVAAVLHTPEPPGGPYPTVVHCPGWTSGLDTPRYADWHARLVAAGFAVLGFDFAGRGRSAASPPARTWWDEVDQLHAAVHFARELSEVDSGRLGLLGSGGTGASHVLLTAANDPTIRALVCQFPIVSGRDWIRSLLSATTWRQLLSDIQTDRAERLHGGSGQSIDFDATWRADSSRGRISLHMLDSLLSYYPIDSAHRIRAASLIIGVEEDHVTPTDHAEQIYDRIPAAKRLIIQRNVDHHESYEVNAKLVIGHIESWFTGHLNDRRVTVADEGSDGRAHA